MKTKHILTAMALPAMFAACTADDIVSENNGLQQDQRAKLSKDFVLNVNNEVESRYAVEGSTNLDFIFAEGDKIGANLIDSYEPGADYTTSTWDKEDPATWKIINTVAPALPFIYEGGVWKSANEDLGIGNYLFTNPFNPADKNRAAASYELPVVVHYSSENPNAHVEAYNKAVAAQITYEGQTSANADLKNIFAYPMIRINFDKNLDVKKVTKVVLARNYTVKTTSNGETTTTVVEGTPFIYKGAFNHQEVAKMFNPKTLEAYLKLNKKNTEESYWAEKQTSDFIIDEKDDDNGADEGQWVTLNDAIDGASDYADIKTTPYFIYEMDETVVANSIDVRFMIPSIADLSSEPDEEKITMYVCTDKGNFEMELTDLNNYQFSNTTLVALKNAAMQRNTSYTLRTKANALVDSPNASIFFNNVVSTAADWNKLVEEYGDLKKYSAEYKAGKTSTANLDAAELIVNIISDKFALTSDIKMPEVAEFVIKSNVNVEGEVTLKNIKVENGKLIVKKDATLTTDPTLNAASVEVEKGGELVFAAEYNDKEELVAYTKMATVHNHGTVTVPAGVIAQFTLQNADKDAVLNVGAAASRAAEVAEAKAILAGYNYGTVNNYSVIDAAGFTNEAAAEKNEDEVTGYEQDEEGEWNGTPTVKNFATFNAKGSVANEGLFENHSVLTSNFVGNAEFANTGILDIKTGAETYIDNNENGEIILAELTPAKGLTIYKARKDANFNPSDDNFKYRGIIKHTLAGKTTEALDMSASPVNYLVADADVEIAKTYTWTDNGGSTAVTRIYPLNTLEVTDAIVTLAARTGAGTEASPYVYPAKVNNLIVNGEVEMDGEWYTTTGGAHVAELTVNAGGVFGVPAESWLQISLAKIFTLTDVDKDEELLEQGKVSVVGTLEFTESTGSESSAVWPKGEDGKYTAADFTVDTVVKNIEINKDAEVKGAKKPAETVDNGEVVTREVILNSDHLIDVYNTDGWNKIDGNDTYKLVLMSGIDMSSETKRTVTVGTTKYENKTNLDLKSILTGAKEVVLKGGSITGLTKSMALALGDLTVETTSSVNGTDGLDILKVNKLTIVEGQTLNITGWLVINTTAVANQNCEAINNNGYINGVVAATNAAGEYLFWNAGTSRWSDTLVENIGVVTFDASTGVAGLQALLDDDNVKVINTTDALTFESNTTLDLRGKVLNLESNSRATVETAAVTVTKGALTLKNGEINSYWHGIFVGEGASLTIEGCSVTGEWNAIRNMAGNVTIKDGIYVGNSDAAVYCDGAERDTDGVWNLTVEQGTFISKKFTAVSLQNNYYVGDGEKPGLAHLKAGTYQGTSPYWDLYIATANAKVERACKLVTNNGVYVLGNKTYSCFVNGVEYKTEGLVSLF